MNKFFIKNNKKIAMFLVLLILCSLTSCKQSEIEKVDNSTLTTSSEIFRCYPNDNLTFLSVNEGKVYYQKSVFDSSFYYFAEKTRNNYIGKSLLNDFLKEENVYLSPIIQPIGSNVFFVEYNNDKGTLNQIDIETKAKKKLLPKDVCGDWIVSNDKIVFQQKKDDIYVLCYQSLADSSINIISNNVESFAVCNNKVRYIENKNTDMLIYEFDLEDKTTIELGSFKIKHYARYMVSFYYGTDSVIFYQGDENKNKQLFIYSIKENKLKEYNLSFGIINISCAVNYAFLASYDGDIYRLCLADGVVEKICDKTNACLALYAIDDFSTCGVFSEDGIFKKSTIYKISNDGVIEKLYQY
ncbi:MAG: DUF5050 domain-containing protein [Clostridia bacterium]|nr:DUF5050 domain-containing protein [Clostridia bacterium]